MTPIDSLYYVKSQLISNILVGAPLDHIRSMNVKGTASDFKDIICKLLHSGKTKLLLQ